MLAIQIVMPSIGDMEILSQEGGVVTLVPMFYGKECAGPHIQVVEIDKAGKTTVVARNRLRITVDGKIELKRGFAQGEQPEP